MNDHLNAQDDSNNRGKDKDSTQDLGCLKSMSGHKRPSKCTQATDGSDKKMV